jgi:tetratricopeptide (TPR) repeat protein
MNPTMRIITSLVLGLMWLHSLAGASSVEDELSKLPLEFDSAKYEAANDDARLKALETVRQHAAALEIKYPKRPEPLVWHAWVLNEQAEMARNFGALGLLKQARKKLEAAIAMEPEACGADAYALLGGLYAQLPGFPISFGNETTGRRHLLKALAMNPAGGLPNLAYARYLSKVSDFDGARQYAKAALDAPPRLSREKADANLRAQAEALIAKSSAKP